MEIHQNDIQQMKIQQNDIQHIEIQQNDIQQNNKNAMLSIIKLTL